VLPGNIPDIVDCFAPSDENKASRARFAGGEQAVRENDHSAMTQESSTHRATSLFVTTVAPRNLCAARHVSPQLRILHKRRIAIREHANATFARTPAKNPSATNATQWGFRSIRRR
jgi:hypothetical protein